MPHTRRTLMLDHNWDICLEPANDFVVYNDKGEEIRREPRRRIRVVDGGYATAQNVANECRLFTNDAYFAQERGIPYYLIALGRKLSPSVLRARLRDAALLVDDVAEVTDIILESLDTETRKVTGDIQFTSREGEHASVEL